MESKTNIWHLILDLSDFTKHWVVAIVSGIVAILLLASGLWYVFLGVLAIWYLWRGNHFVFSKKAKIVWTCVIVIVVIVIWSVYSYRDRTPVITIREPADGASIQTYMVDIKGTVIPAYSDVHIITEAVGTTSSKDSAGNFDFPIVIDSATTTVKIEANNGGKSISTTLTVFRIYTPEELAQMQADLKAKQQASIQAQAAQAAFNSSPTGEQQRLASTAQSIISGFSAPVWTKMSYKNVNIGDDDSDRPAGSKLVNIEVYASDFHTKDGFTIDSSELASDLFQNAFPINQNIYDIIISYYGNTTDQYGNQSDSVMMTYSMDVNTFKKINWSGFNKDNLCNFLQEEANSNNGDTACIQLVNI